MSFPGGQHVLPGLQAMGGGEDGGAVGIAVADCGFDMLVIVDDDGDASSGISDIVPEHRQQPVVPQFDLVGFRIAGGRTDGGVEALVAVQEIEDFGALGGGLEFQACGSDCLQLLLRPALRRPACLHLFDADADIEDIFEKRAVKPANPHALVGFNLD